MRAISLFLSLCFLFFFNCHGYDPEASRFWKESIAVNESMESAFKGTNVFAILQGSLNPKDESLLYPIDEDKIYLAVEGRKTGDKWNIKKVKSSNPKSQFTSKTVYTKILSGDDELYEVDRKQTGRLGNASPSVTFKGLEGLISKGPQGTLTHDFLCKSMNCGYTDISQNRKLLTYELDKKTEATYPAFYKKFGDRLPKIQFKCIAIPDSRYGAKIVVSNSQKRINIDLPPEKESSFWKSPKIIDFSLDFVVNSYGLTLTVKNMKYRLGYSKSNARETLSGRFSGLPESKIEGRFFYIIPQGFVNLFIPDDIESYLKKGLKLLTVGSDGKKGNRFTIHYSGKGKSMTYDLRSYSETYRKRFSLFGERKPEEEEGKGNQRIFFRDLNLSIADDLAKQ